MDNTTHRTKRVFLLFTLPLIWLASVAYAVDTSPSFRVLKQWTIPNGGFGRILVLNKPKPTEQQLRSLGDDLQHLTRGDRNAYVAIYDDEKAARHRDAAISERLTKSETKQHDRHYLGLYVRNANTGHNEFQIYPKGFDGPNIIQNY